MLQFLVKSKARRRLLTLLWADGVRGSVSGLAEQAALALATPQAELKGMRQFGLAQVIREGRKDVYCANWDHPQADALKALLDGSKSEVQPYEIDADVKGWLKSLGAPLRVEDTAAPMPSLSGVLVEGLRTARKDPTVARSLPLVFWFQRDNLDVSGLLKMVRRPEEKHSLGFFLELTGELGSDRRLKGLAEAFKDKRMTAERDFFLLPTSESGRKLAESSTPDVARRWGFRMNLDYSAFESLFNKFADRRA